MKRNREEGQKMDETLIDTLIDKMNQYSMYTKLWSLTPSGEEILRRLEMSEEEWEAEKDLIA